MASLPLRFAIAAFLVTLGQGVAAQTPAPRLQSAAEALAQDAADYVRLYGVPLEEAMRRLRAQEESVPATDAIRRKYPDRIAGISIEHRPVYRIVVLLKGPEAVADDMLAVGGMNVPIVFRTGAAATQGEVIAAIRTHQAAIRSSLRHPPGLGADGRTGELVIMVQPGDVSRQGGVEAMKARYERMTEVPVRIRITNQQDRDTGIEGGARLVGTDPANGRRYACTTGFVVTDGARTGVVTAAHCPDTLTYVDPHGGEIPLDFIGQWGWAYRDVQVHVGGNPQRPHFYADTAKTAVRTLQSWRNRASTRVGDVVCHRGERTGYSCAEVELVDYAPPGDLCGGPCDPTWVAVAGPSCKAGDSGGPIFSRTTAFGIVKGGNYRKDGTCNFYFYMSTDYLPDGWTLLY